MWARVVAILNTEKNIEEILPLHCPSHLKAAIEMPTSSDFSHLRQKPSTQAKMRIGAPRQNVKCYTFLGPFIRNNRRATMAALINEQFNAAVAARAEFHSISWQKQVRWHMTGCKRAIKR